MTHQGDDMREGMLNILVILHMNSDVTYNMQAMLHPW